MTLEKAYTAVNNKIAEKAQTLFPEYSKEDLKVYQVESPATMEKVLADNGVVKTSDGYFMSPEKVDSVAQHELSERVSVRAPSEYKEAHDIRQVEMMKNEISGNLETAAYIEDPAQAAELLRRTSDQTEQLQEFYAGSSLRVDDEKYQDIADELDSIRADMAELAEEIERDGINYDKEDSLESLQTRVENLGTPARISEPVHYGYDENER